MTAHHGDLVERCRGLPAMRTAVVYPGDRLSLESAVSAGTAGLIVPVLVGNANAIAALARAENLDLEGCEVLEASESREAATRAVELARSGAVQALMKGSLHSDELLHQVAAPGSGLHTNRRLTHAYVMDLPSYPEPLLITDAVVNISPTLDDKRDIVQNAIDLALALGIAEVRVALLSAVETINSRVPSTIDAAALCKMADRKQIVGALVDGPLALDDAVSAQAADEKGIVSPVAGRANVLVVPDFESGNMLAKALILLAGGAAAGVVLGASVPIALTSRADSVETHVASLAIARLLAENGAAPTPRVRPPRREARPV
jgi:phosphate acetyltransferase